jgi:molecular chaperone DnaK
MAADNVSLGMFTLEGIPPAPRGVPKIEVTFDIDANGILHVSAKDLATGKENKITITSRVKLSEEEKQRMIKEAEMYAEQDKKKLEEALARNEADATLYNSKKFKEQFKDKLVNEDLDKISKAENELQEALKKNDVNLIKEKTNALKEVLGTISTRFYSSTGSSSSGQQNYRDVSGSGS